MLAVAVVLSPACRSAARPLEGGVPSGGKVDELLLSAMNPFLLSDLFDTPVGVEVDWVEGGEPAPEALRALEEKLVRHTAPGRPVDVTRSGVIPAVELQDLEGRRGLEQLVARHLEADPSAWQSEETLYVLYLPRSEPFYGIDVLGMQDHITFERGGQIRTVPVLMVFFEAVRDEALLWIGPTKIERAMLAHELGHLLGLVSNPEHTQQDHPDHCTQPQCVLNRPGLGSTLYNAPPAFFAGRVRHELCDRCLADIERVRQLWSEEATADPDYRGRLVRQRIQRQKEAAEIWLTDPDATVRPRPD